MTSLSYSEYQSSDGAAAAKKRIPQLGKPNIPPVDETTPPVKEVQLNRINQLILQNTMAPPDDRMGSFTPLSPPQLTTEPKKEVLDYSQQQFIPPGGGSAPPVGLPFPESDKPFSNYRYVYQTPPAMTPFLKRGGGSGGGGGTAPRREMDKMWEKLNYITMLLEEQRMERTQFVTEEFVLYMFLGIFIIYVVDGFSRSSVKYVR
jgi:hypothetical protein